jgi:hypothetical protein
LNAIGAESRDLMLWLVVSLSKIVAQSAPE